MDELLQDLQKLMLQGMIHDPEVRRGAAIALDPVLFPDPSYRQAFVALASESSSGGFTPEQLRSFEQKYSLTQDLRALATESFPTKEQLRPCVALLKSHGGKAVLSATLEQTLFTLAQPSSEALPETRKLRSSLDALLYAMLPWEETHPSQKTLQDQLHAAIGRIENYSQQGLLGEVQSGFIDLDKMLGGFQPGIYVLSARPSLDMTAFALGIAEHLGAESHKTVLYNTLKSTQQELMFRMLCSKARVNLRNVREGFLAERDFSRLTGAATKLFQSKIHLQSLRSVDTFYAECARLKSREGLSLAIVDCFQQYLPSSPNSLEMSAQEYVLGKQFFDISRELSLPILLLSEMSGEIDRKVNALKPTVGYIRNHAAFEYDARAVLMLWQPRLFSEETPREDAVIPVNCFVGINHDGPIGDVCLSYISPFRRYESAAKVSDADE